MENWSYHTKISLDTWFDVYSYVRVGDLVLVGPVQDRNIGIAIERKVVNFGFDPDDWSILINGRVEVHSEYYVQAFTKS
jgi:hypothetical protein